MSHVPLPPPHHLPWISAKFPHSSGHGATSIAPRTHFLRCPRSLGSTGSSPGQTGGDGLQQGKDPAL